MKETYLVFPSKCHFIILHFQSELSQLGTRLDDVLCKMKAFKDQLKQVSQELEGTKSLLQAVARETGVNFIDVHDDEKDD